MKGALFRGRYKYSFGVPFLVGCAAVIVSVVSYFEPVLPQPTTSLTAILGLLTAILWLIVSMYEETRKEKVYEYAQKTSQSTQIVENMIERAKKKGQGADGTVYVYAANFELNKPNEGNLFKWEKELAEELKTNRNLDLVYHLLASINSEKEDWYKKVKTELHQNNTKFNLRRTKPEVSNCLMPNFLIIPALDEVYIGLGKYDKEGIGGGARIKDKTLAMTFEALYNKLWFTDKYSEEET